MKQLKDIYKNITKGRKVLRKQIEQKSLNVTFVEPLPAYTGRVFAANILQLTP